MCTYGLELARVWAAAVADYLIYVLFLSVSFSRCIQKDESFNICSGRMMCHCVDVESEMRRTSKMGGEEEDYDCKFLFVLYESSPLSPREMMLIMMMVVVFCVSLLLLILKHLRSSLIEAIGEKFSKLSLIFNITNFHIRPISGPESSHLWNLKNQANNSAHHHEQWILIWKVLLAFCGVSNDEIYSLDDLNYLMDCDNHRVDTNSFW